MFFRLILLLISDSDSFQASVNWSWLGNLLGYPMFEAEITWNIPQGE